MAIDEKKLIEWLLGKKYIVIDENSTEMTEEFEKNHQWELSRNCFINNIIKFIESQPKVGEWIPFKLREADEEEQWEYGFTNLLDCKLPENDEEILITYSNGYVGTDMFLKDGFECYLDSNSKMGTEAIAYMPLPKPYKTE